ncbi:MAG: hypothetical protein JW878_02590 [Methanomicrobia archaeon]|nr:hypothetical protein [Methanomicrobia archaeon]
MQEVESALRAMEGYTILIKGAPGTGKTTYAMTLLERLCQEDANAKGVYISTRIDPSALYKQFPGLEERVPYKNVIDATQSEFSEAGTQVLYDDLPSFLRAVYSVVAEEDVTVQIVDSWDAVSFQIGKESVERLETSMLDIARKTKTHLILITEYADEKKLDYLVDCILRIEKGQIDDRIVRRVYIDKMRGVQVPRSNYPFTLEGGKFTHFVTAASDLGSGRHKVIENGKGDLPDGSYSTGIVDLDRLIGGYPRGSFILLEIGEDSISWDYRPVLFHTLANFLGNDCGVIYMPEDGFYSSSVKKLLSDYVSDEVLNKNLRMPTISLEESEEAPCFFHVDVDIESIREHLDKHFEVYKELKKPVLYVLGLTRLNIYSEEDIRGTLSEIVSWIRTTNDVLVGVLKPSAKLKNEICEMADIHLRFISINGTLNLYGVKPYTAINNISPAPPHTDVGEENGENRYHQLKFTPLM